MQLKTDISNTRIKAGKISEKRKAAEAALEKLWSSEMKNTGWLTAPLDFNRSDSKEIFEIADKIVKTSDVLIVVGAGGSSMGARALIDMLGGSQRAIEIIFVGYDFSGRYMREVVERVKDKDISIYIASKSGATAETLSAYAVLREFLVEKYGKKGAADRTYIITEYESPLWNSSEDAGFNMIKAKNDIGGRYSVLTAVGLIPAAVAGIDIGKIIEGAGSIADKTAFSGKMLDYAAARHLLYENSKCIEIFDFFDPYMSYFGEWLKQLFGESEGKEGKGLFPVSLIFSRDLHSIGQFLQQGRKSFFETFITAENHSHDVRIPNSAIKPFAGKTMEEINACAARGALDAHIKAEIPVISITVPSFDEYAAGELIYFFEVQCAVSAIMFGVNPFDQPGVELYKEEMMAYIDKINSPCNN